MGKYRRSWYQVMSKVGCYVCSQIQKHYGYKAECGKQGCLYKLPLSQEAREDIELWLIKINSPRQYDDIKLTDYEYI